MKEITSEEVYNACQKIAEHIKKRSPQEFTLVAVSRGGLVPATIISHYLNCKEIKFIRLSSYNANQEKSEIIDTTNDIIPDNENTYIIDDLCDSGETLLYLRQKYPHSQICTLINKNPQILPDYFPLTEPMGLWINFPWEVEDRK